MFWAWTLRQLQLTSRRYGTFTVGARSETSSGWIDLFEPIGSVKRDLVRELTHRGLQAYRFLAKKHHPDRGGTAAQFGRLQQAFEVLSDPQQRDVYDTWAKEVQFRYVRGTSAQVGRAILPNLVVLSLIDFYPWLSQDLGLCQQSVDILFQNAELNTIFIFAQAAGGEDILLDEFEGLGLHCDPHTQLVVTCEVCRRPATKECWTCSMKICEFCTLKRHWKVSLHGLTHASSKRLSRCCTCWSHLPVTFRQFCCRKP